MKDTEGRESLVRCVINRGDILKILSLTSILRHSLANTGSGLKTADCLALKVGVVGSIPCVGK